MKVEAGEIWVRLKKALQKCLSSHREALKGSEMIRLYFGKFGVVAVLRVGWVEE